LSPCLKFGFFQSFTAKKTAFVDEPPGPRIQKVQNGIVGAMPSEPEMRLEKEDTPICSGMERPPTPYSAMFYISIYLESIS
jgi:hypothetical protein